MIKTVLIIVDVVAAAILLNFLVLVPYQQNVMKKEIERTFDAAYDALQAGDGIQLLPAVRSNVQRLRMALRISPTDLDLSMELAALYRVLGRHEEAISVYRHALRYHQRPEIYRNLAESQFALRDLAGATESYAHSVAFFPGEVNSVPNALIPAVMKRAEEIVEQLSGGA